MQAPRSVRHMIALLRICVNRFGIVLIDKHTLIVFARNACIMGHVLPARPVKHCASVTSNPLAFGALNRLGDQPSEPPVDAHPQSSPPFNHAITHTLNASLLQHAIAASKVQPEPTARSMQRIAGISCVSHVKMMRQTQTLLHSMIATCRYRRTDSPASARPLCHTA